jgi:hypothetical protein
MAEFGEWNRKGAALSEVTGAIAGCTPFTFRSALPYQ